MSIFCKVNRALLGFYLKTSQKFNLLTNSHDHLDCELDWPSAMHRFRAFFQTWCKLLLTDQAPASRWASSRLSFSNGRKQSCGIWVTRLLMRHNVLLVFGCGRSAGLLLWRKEHWLRCLLAKDTYDKVFLPFRSRTDDQDPIKFCGRQIYSSLTTPQAPLLNQGTRRLNSLVFKEQH